VTEPYVACDGGCERWFHPGCIGFTRCGEHGASRCLINEENGRGHENITRSFICRECRAAQPFRVIPHWPTPGQHYGTSARLLGPKIPISIPAIGATTSSKRGRRRTSVNYAEMAGLSPTSSIDAGVDEDESDNVGLVSTVSGTRTTAFRRSKARRRSTSESAPGSKKKSTKKSPITTRSRPTTRSSR